MIPTNREISLKLRERANVLAHRGENLYRVRAFRKAAMAVLALPEEVSAIVAIRGEKALEHVPAIGRSLAQTISEFVLQSEPAPSTAV